MTLMMIWVQNIFFFIFGSSLIKITLIFAIIFRKHPYFLMGTVSVVFALVIITVWLCAKHVSLLYFLIFSSMSSKKTQKEKLSEKKQKEKLRIPSWTWRKQICGQSPLATTMFQVNLVKQVGKVVDGPCSLPMMTMMVVSLAFANIFYKKTE